MGGLPTQWNEQHVVAVLVHGTGPRLRKSIAVLAHRLRAAQSSPENSHVRRGMDPLSADYLCLIHDDSPCGAHAESAQVRNTLGEHRSCYPEPHDVQKPRIESL